jgi:PilX N-terminal
MCRRETSTWRGRLAAIRGEDGIAMVLAMMAMLLMVALGSALVLTTSSEGIIASNFRDSSEALYAADSALERTVADLSRVSDWNTVLAGAVQSAFVDGAAGGTRVLADGSTIDLGQIVNLANCSKTAACTSDELTAATRARPWGANNPLWRLYAYGRLANVRPEPTDSPYYVVAMAADDASENDGEAEKDGDTPCGGEEPVLAGDPPAPSCNPGTGVIALRAEAFGPRGARKVVEMTIARRCPALRSTAANAAICGDSEDYSSEGSDVGMGPSVRILSWREVK